MDNYIVMRHEQGAGFYGYHLQAYYRKCGVRLVTLRSVIYKFSNTSGICAIRRDALGCDKWSNLLKY